MGKKWRKHSQQATGNVTTPHTTTNSVAKPYTPRTEMIALLDDEQILDIIPAHVENINGAAWHGICRRVITKESKESTVAVVPIEFYRAKKKLVGRNWKPGPCVFNSTVDYFHHILGMNLGEDDQDFFNAHPLLESHGTPMQYTGRIVQELVQPYGVRISHIRMAAGVQPPGELADWMDYLGVNPFARNNWRTTNEEFAQITGQSLEDVNRQFQFDFGDIPLRPSIVCQASKAHNYAGASGHANYLSPRGKHGEVWISLQLDRSGFPNKQQPNFISPEPEYIEVPDLHAILAALQADDDEFLERLYAHQRPQAGFVAEVPRKATPALLGTGSQP